MNVNNKNKLYEFEKIAIIVVLVLVIVIGAIVISIATSGNDSRSDEGKNSELVIEGTSDSSGAGDSSNESVQDNQGGLSGNASSPNGGTSGIEFETISVDNSMLSEGEVLLVNQDYEFSKNIDEYLVNVYSEKQKNGQAFVLSTTALELRNETFEALCEMLEGFSKDTHISSKTLMLSKAYISVEEQQKEYEKDAAELDSSKLPYLQAGGESEHHTGLAFHMKVYPESNGKMGQGAYEWFYDNCWKYGFILRYPEGAEDRTQAFADSTHFRYVGIPHAAFMHVNQLVFEDYLEYLQDRTSHENRETIKDSDGVGYELYAVKAGENGKTDIPVPKADSGCSYTVSGANNGYFIVAIKVD